MAYTSLGSSSNSDSEVDSCSKSCVKAYATLKEQYDNLNSDYNNLLESQVSDKFKTRFGYNAATAASPAVESFVNSSDLLENQECNRPKGYHAVPPPYTGNFIPRKPDLTFMDEIVESENMDVTTIVTPSNVKKVKSNHESAGVKNNGDAVEPKTVRENSFIPSIIEDWNPDDESEIDYTVRPSIKKIKLVKTVKINTAGAKVNIAVRPVNTVGSKPTVNHPRPISNAYKKRYLQVTRSVNKFSANKNSIFNKKVNNVRVKDTTARDRAVAKHIENLETASASTSKNEEMEITTTIDGRVKTITEESLRRHLKLEDADGISSLPNTKIFEQLALMGYAENLDSRSKFLMYPRFIQILLNKHKRHLLPHKRTYVAPTLTQKLFSNMRRVSKGYTRVDIPLFQSMLVQGPIQQGEGSTVPVDSHHTPTSAPSISQQPPTPPFMQTIHDAEEPATMPHDSSQPRVQSLGSDEGSLTLNELTVLCTTLSKKVEDLQNDLKRTKFTYDAAYTKLILRVKKLEHKPTELVEDFGSGEKGEKEISTANMSVSTSSANPEVSTAGVSTTEVVLSTVIPEVSTGAENLVYIRRSAEKRKDKGKVIMKEDEFVQKKTKKQLEQERLSHEASIRLQEHVNEEERQRISRDAEIAKQLQEEINTTREEQEKPDLEKALELQKQLDERKEVVAEADPAQVINWSDPTVLRYHAQQNRSFSKSEILDLYLKEYDQNQSFVPKDSEIEKEVMERSGFDFQKPPAKRQKIREVSGSVKEQSTGKEKEVSEKELKKLLVIVTVEEVYIESLQRFDRDDLEKLWDLVKKKFSSTEPTIDKEQVLWVELKRLFEPDDDDTLWKLQKYMLDLLKGRLYDACGVHHVSTERGHDIFMLVEKDYPLTRALMTVMLVNKLQVDESSKMANELLRKIFYQVERTRT
ncbi:hypothetical protein Tco_1575876 [Tanacetum coccineum]